MLLPFSWIYGAAVAARNRGYDTGLLPIRRVEVPVISVGNIVSGGTGKTPLVGYIVDLLLRSGARPAVLSRGYRRSTSGTLTVSDGSTVLADAAGAGDEPWMLAHDHPGCVVVVDEDRVRGARYTTARHRPDAIVLDDGFQHRALGRDIDIVVLGAARGGRPPRMLPAGDGREPASSLGRADFLVLRQPDGRPPGIPGGIPCARLTYEPGPIVIADSGAHLTRDSLVSGGFVAFCGIGDPASFTGTLDALGAAPAAMLRFPDHHRYSAADLRRIERARRGAGARFALTTAKDAARLAGVPLEAPLAVLRVDAVLTEGRDGFDRAVLAAARRTA